MPQYGVTLKLPGGGYARVCGNKPMRVCICEAKVSAYLCDYPMGPPVLDHNASRDVGGPVYQPPTCDAPLCEDCRVPQGEGVDYCPSHDSDANHVSHLSHVTRTNQQAHMTDARGQEYLL